MKITFTPLFIICLAISLTGLPESVTAADYRLFLSFNEVAGHTQDGIIPSAYLQDNETATLMSGLADADKELTAGYISSSFSVRVYPNPATDFIRVEWSADVEAEVHVELYDLVGTRITQSKSDNSVNHIRINLESFQRSAYLLKVYTGDGTYSRTYRVVKY